MKPRLVIAGLTRNPCNAYHWMPDQVRHDNRDHGLLRFPRNGETGFMTTRVLNR